MTGSYTIKVPAGSAAENDRAPTPIVKKIPAPTEKKEAVKEIEKK